MIEIKDNVQQEVVVNVRVLAKIWEENGIWNVSAFDLPVVAFGETMKDAQHNFEDAIESHFEVLVGMNRMQTAAHRLNELAAERDFYEARMTPNVTVQSFFSPVHSPALCLVGA